MKHRLFMIVGTSATLLLSAINSQVSAKEYYKWVDSKGSTHYTTTPPPKSAKKQGKLETHSWNNSAPYQPTATQKPESESKHQTDSQTAPAQTSSQQNTAQPSNNSTTPASATLPPAS